MSAPTETLRQDIDEIRDAMTEKLAFLEMKVRRSMGSTLDQVRHSLDLERHVHERPWVSLGLAALAGYILGTLDEGPEAAYGGQPVAPPPPAGEAGELSAIGAAAASAVAGVLREALGESLPHFEEEYARARRGE